MTSEPVVPVVVAADERDTAGSDADVIDVERWRLLATAVLVDSEAGGELTLTFVDESDIADLNQHHMGKVGPTDVLSFPMEEEADVGGSGEAVPVLLGDIVVCPSVARSQFIDHAGTLDDELALLVVHGVLHVLGHDHADPAQAAEMRERELELLVAHHWHAPAPQGFRQTHD